MYVSQKTLRLLTSIPLVPSFSHAFFSPSCDLLQYSLSSTLQHEQQTGSVTESCCSSFVRATKRLHWDCELRSPRWPPAITCQATKGDSWAPTARHAHRECSAAKLKGGVARMRFIHLNKVDHQTDVAAEVLVRQRKEHRETGRRGVKQTGHLSCSVMLFFPALILWMEQYLSTCWQHPGTKAHFCRTAHFNLTPSCLAAPEFF